MTIIKSVFEHSPQTLLIESGIHEGETYVRVNQGGTPNGDAMVPTAELLAALNAVDANKVLQDASDALDKRRGLEARAEAAEAVLAAGYRKPRTVTTAAELDALPEWSVVMHVYSDGSRSLWMKENGKWFATGCEDADPTVELLLEDDHSTPATVLHEPEAER